MIKLKRIRELIRPGFLTDEQFEELKEIIINSKKNYTEVHRFRRYLKRN